MVVLETRGVLLPEAASSLLLHKGKTVREVSGVPKVGFSLGFPRHGQWSGAKTTLFISMTRVSTPFPLKTNFAPWWALFSGPTGQLPGAQTDGSDTCLLAGVVPSSLVGRANPEKLLYQVPCDVTFYLGILKLENCRYYKAFGIYLGKKWRIFISFFMMKVIGGTC